MSARLLVFAGPPCAGKSTLAGAVQANFEFRWLQVDRILSFLMPNSQRSKGDRDVGYRAMHLLGEELLRSHRDVIFDATYGAREHRWAVEALVKALAVPLRLIEFHVSPDVAAARFRGRSDHPASDLTEERVRNIARLYCYSDCGLAVTAEMSPSAALKQIESYLQAEKRIDVDGRWSSAASGYSV